MKGVVTDASASTYFPLNHNSLSASFASSHHCNLPSAVTTTGEPYSLASDYTARKIALTDEIVRILDAHDDVSSKVVDFMREVMSSKLNNALHVTHTPVKRRTRVEHTHPFPHPCFTCGRMALGWRQRCAPPRCTPRASTERISLSWSNGSRSSVCAPGLSACRFVVALQRETLSHCCDTDTQTHRHTDTQTHRHTHTRTHIQSLTQTNTLPLPPSSLSLSLCPCVHSLRGRWRSCAGATQRCSGCRIASTVAEWWRSSPCARPIDFCHSCERSTSTYRGAEVHDVAPQRCLHREILTHTHRYSRTQSLWLHVVK